MFGGEKRRVFAAANALDCNSDLREDQVPFVRKMFRKTSHVRGVLAGSLRCWNTTACWALHSMSSCGCRQVVRSGMTSTPSAITTTMLHLCSAPCKALRFASPVHLRGLRALTVPARRSPLGHYVMVGSLMTLSWTDLDR
jgi:hypothetical protein